MTDELGFTADGPWFQLPTWRKALAWLRWRPYFWVRGEVVHWRVRLADKYGDRPPLWRRMYWIGAGEADDLVTGERVVAIHGTDCEAPDCGEARGTVHHLAWDPFDDYRWLGDRFDEKVGRWYSLDRPSGGDDAP